MEAVLKAGVGPARFRPGSGQAQQIKSLLKVSFKVVTSRKFRPHLRYVFIITESLSNGAARAPRDVSGQPAPPLPMLLLLLQRGGQDSDPPGRKHAAGTSRSRETGVACCFSHMDPEAAAPRRLS